MISNFCIYNTYTKSVQYGYLPWPTSWGRWSSTDDPRKVRKARSFLNTRHPAFPNIRIFLGDETVYRVRIQLELSNTASGNELVKEVMSILSKNEMK